MATTAPAVGLMEFTPPLDYSKRNALETLHYGGATKVKQFHNKTFKVFVDVFIDHSEHDMTHGLK